MRDREEKENTLIYRNIEIQIDNNTTDIDRWMEAERQRDRETE